jgi:putative resolvase
VKGGWSPEQRHDCKIIVANQESLSPPQEMVQDLMAIVHCFSSRLYGLRSYRKKIKEAAEANEQGHAYRLL